MNPMDQFSFYVYGWGPQPPTMRQLAQTAQRAEELGFYSIGIPYHLTVPESWMFTSLGNSYLLDSMAVLPALAQATRTIRIGVHSLILPLLHPYVWAKYLASVDVVSEGRLIPGMCIGWSMRDFDAVGVDIKQRGKMTEEQIEVITRLWTEDRVTHEGRFYHLRDVSIDPKPVQKPHPPIWYGGGFPAIPRAARYAQYIAPFALTPKQVEMEYIPRLQEENQRWGTETKIVLNNFVLIEEDDDKLKNEARPRLDQCVDFPAMVGPDVKAEDLVICGPPERCAQLIRELQEAGVSHFLLDFNYHGLESFDFLLRQAELFVEKVVPLL
ncbi:MAG: LLM class flavin-dependent oxidoreductase [Dehalococcoidia bacterium]